MKVENMNPDMRNSVENLQDKVEKTLRRDVNKHFIF